MDSSPPKPKSALPLHLTNGTSPLHASTETRDKRERESLYAAIQSSNSHGRQAIDFDAPNGYNSTPQGPRPDQRATRTRSKPLPNDVEEGHARDPRDEVVSPTPLAMSRAQSPYTQHPTIDFDGLSWPSKCGYVLHCFPGLTIWSQVEELGKERKPRRNKKMRGWQN